MRARVAIYIIAALMIGTFFIANWALLRSPVPLNLLFASVEMPLAILVLLCAGVVITLNLAGYAFAEHTWRAERRRLAEEVADARRRAERAEDEELRTQGLRVAMESEFVAVRAQLDRVLIGVQRLQNDTMEIPEPPPRTIELEPELIPPRSATRG